MEKRCTRCRKKKAVTEFHKNARQKDGFQVWCKTCVRTHQNEQRSLDPEAYREYQRQWFARNPGYFKGYLRVKPEKPHGTRVIWNED